MLMVSEMDSRSACREQALRSILEIKMLGASLPSTHMSSGILLDDYVPMDHSFLYLHSDVCDLPFYTTKGFQMTVSVPARISYTAQRRGEDIARWTL